MTWDCGCDKRREALKSAFKKLAEKLMPKKQPPKPKKGK